jgi:GNAT superfamily N-acetyltransferase
LSNAIEIVPYSPEHREAVLSLSLAAWAPVFEKMQPAVPDYVFDAFYPNGWRARQLGDIETFLDESSDLIWLAIEDSAVVGWIGGKFHPEDKMGEIYILAVSPDAQRKGVAGALMRHFFDVARTGGMVMMMVETGDDPGHNASRATYENIGFERWPVARYFRKL